MQMCFIFYFIYFLTVSQKKCLGGGRCGTAVFRENLVAIYDKHDKRLWIWIYPWISMNIFMDIQGKFVDMNMDMDGKFHIHGKPANWTGDHGRRAFTVAGSRLGNTLPHEVTSAPILPVFFNRLKWHLFKVFFPPN